MLDAAFARAASRGEVADRLNVSRRTLQLIYRRERSMSYGMQIQLEAIARGELPCAADGQIDGPALVARTIEVIGDEAELAARLGVTKRYLSMLLNRERSMSYAMQYLLQSLLREHEANAVPPE